MPQVPSAQAMMARDEASRGLGIELVDSLVRALKLGLGAVDLDLVIAGVELEQYVAGLDSPIV